MFWTNIASANPRIERAYLDGTALATVIETTVMMPGALAVDPKSQRIFWTDMDLKRIESANFDGGDAVVLADHNIREPAGLTVLGNYLFWIDSDINLIERMNKNNGSNRLKIQGRLPGLSDIHAVEYVSRDDLKKHPCGVNNGGCSHICVTKGNDQASCSCPLGLMLAAEGSCTDPPTCGTDYFTCGGTQHECIPETWRCDGIEECTDGSDEHRCPGCSKLQFRCESSGECISRERRCDGEKDCNDGSDEENCAPCGEGMWECSDNVCINMSSHCDDIMDCFDEEDEAHCPLTTQPQHPSGPATAQYTVSIVVCLLFVLAVLLVIVFVCRRRSQPQLPEESILMLSKLSNAVDLQSLGAPPNTLIGASSSLLPPPYSTHAKDSKSPVTSCLTFKTVDQSSSGPPYDRNHVTGASSSSSSRTHYPKATLNPPPSPVTDRSVFAEGYSSNSPSTTRSYKQFVHSNIPPPPTPCSTDVCDDSEACSSLRDYEMPRPTKSTKRHRSHKKNPQAVFFPPPPTPHSHYLSDDLSCPPSPSTERSFFNPHPPPPSPVATSDC